MLSAVLLFCVVQYLWKREFAKAGRRFVDAADAAGASKTGRSDWTAAARTREEVARCSHFSNALTSLRLLYHHSAPFETKPATLLIIYLGQDEHCTTHWHLNILKQATAPTVRKHGSPAIQESGELRGADRYTMMHATLDGERADML